MLDSVHQYMEEGFAGNSAACYPARLEFFVSLTSASLFTVHSPKAVSELHRLLYKSLLTLTEHFLLPLLHMKRIQLVQHRVAFIAVFYLARINLGVMEQEGAAHLDELAYASTALAVYFALH